MSSFRSRAEGIFQAALFFAQTVGCQRRPARSLSNSCCSRSIFALALLGDQASGAGRLGRFRGRQGFLGVQLFTLLAIRR